MNIKWINIFSLVLFGLLLAGALTMCVPLQFHVFASRVCYVIGSSAFAIALASSIK